jgi:hypothetical protein
MVKEVLFKISSSNILRVSNGMIHHIQTKIVIPPPIAITIVSASPKKSERLTGPLQLS